MGWNLIWHDRDLRVEDNPALVAAAKGRVVPLYIHCPEDEGRWRAGSASQGWLHHSLAALGKRYRELGTRLVIRSGSARKVLDELSRELDIDAIYWNFRHEPHLSARDERIARQLEKRGIVVHRFEGNYLISPSELMNKSGKPYTVFTPFYNAVLRERGWRKPLRTPKIVRSHRLSSENLDLPAASNWSDFWEPGRTGAKRALRAFRNRVRDYPQKHDLPGITGTSRLSPHLHFGEISPHEIWEAIDCNTKGGAAFLRQLIWREFGNAFLVHFPSATTQSWREKFGRFPWVKDRRLLRAWQQGRTGYPIVDAGMRELRETGWMHNRVRLVVGSFLVKDLFVHWIEGAKWFWEHLVDADLANNTLGWQWVAGSGPDAAPYFRIFNPVLQGQKFDPEGTYVRRWVPELADLPAKWIHCPWEAPTPVKGYPPPLVDHAEARDRALRAYKKLL